MLSLSSTDIANSNVLKFIKRKLIDAQGGVYRCAKQVAGLRRVLRRHPDSTTDPRCAPISACPSQVCHATWPHFCAYKPAVSFERLWAQLSAQVKLEETGYIKCWKCDSLDYLASLDLTGFTPPDLEDASSRVANCTVPQLHHFSKLAVLPCFATPALGRQTVRWTFW